MKQYIKLFVPALVLLLLIGCGQQPKSSGGGQDAETTTRKVTTTCLTDLVFTLNGEETVYTVTYEEDGVRLMPQLTSPDSYKIAYKYGWDGQLLLDQALNEDGSVHYETKYTYDAAGNLTESMISYPDDGKSSRKLRTYNEQGKLSAMIYYDYSGNVSSQNAYTYDQQGFLSECLVTGYNGKQKWRYVYACDEAGRIISGQRYVLSEDLGQTGLQSNLVYTYDDAGRLLSIQWKPIFENNYLRQSMYFTYDEAGRMTHYQVFHQEKDLYEEETYRYDGSGHLCEVLYARSGLSSTWTLSYGSAELDSRVADNAQAWSSTGIIKALIPVADPILSQ